MLSTAPTFTLDAISARSVLVEVEIHRGLPGFTVAGLPDVAVREARERIRAALVNCALQFPLQRIRINLTAGDLRTADPAFDLAIAAGILGASSQIDMAALTDIALVGELCHLSLPACPGGLPEAAKARRAAGASAVVIHLPSPLLDSVFDADPGLAPSGALLRADLPGARLAVAGMVRSMRERCLAVAVLGHRLSWVAERRALFGALAPGSPGALPERLVDRLLARRLGEAAPVPHLRPGAEAGADYAPQRGCEGQGSEPARQ